MRLFFSVLVASVASVAFAGVALAAGPNENLFGNTVTITSAAGVTKAMVNKDGTYMTMLPDGKMVKGTWAAGEGNTTCYTQTDPAPAADMKPFCPVNDERKVGDTWENKGPDGSVVKFALVAGQ